jgi:hypothetical protein
VPGEVAHALQVRAHPQAGDDEPQVRRDRRLPREQGQGPLLEVDLQPVDRLVGRDDALGQREVGVQQGRRRSPDRRPHPPRHLDQQVGDGLELLVELLPHVLLSVRPNLAPPLPPRPRHRVSTP